jgi:hypothetical protein
MPPLWRLSKLIRNPTDKIEFYFPAGGAAGLRPRTAATRTVAAVERALVLACGRG